MDNKYKLVSFILSFIFSLLIFEKIYSAYITYSDVLPQLNAILKIYNPEYAIPGQNLSVNVSISYSSPYYIPDARFVIDVAKVNDNNSFYPFQYTTDNIFAEYVYNVSLYPGENLNLNLEIPIPSNIESGKYYLVGYLYSPLTYIDGVPFIFLPGYISTFYVNNPSGNYPYIEIDKQLTTLNQYTGPIGSPTLDYINITLVLNSSLNTNATIYIYYSRWDDITRPRILIYENNVNLNQGLNYFNIYYNISNLPPDAYDVLILVYSNNQLQSLYRLRFIKEGATALIRGILLEGNGNITYIVGPSPDHYTFPITPNVSLQVFSPQLGYERIYNIGNVGYYLTGFVYITSHLNINTSNFEICANVYSGNNLLDTHCIYYENFSLQPYAYINVESNNLTLCTNINGELFIYNTNSGRTNSYLISPGCSSYLLNNGNYVITFYSNNYQNSWNITISSLSSSSYTSSISKTSSVTQKVSYNSEYYYIIGAIILMLIIIILIYYYMRRRGIFLIAFIISLIFSSLIFSQGSGISFYPSPIYLCSPYGNFSVITNYNVSPYYVNISIYNNGSLIYSNLSECSNYECEYNVSLYNVTPAVQYTINVTAFEVLGNSTGKNILSILFGNNNYTINVLGSVEEGIQTIYPFDFEILTNPLIYNESEGSVQVSIDQNCSYIQNYNQTLFNFTMESLTYGTVYNVSENCPYNESVCTLYTQTLPNDTYELYSQYQISYQGQSGEYYIYNYNQSIGEISIVLPPTGIFFENVSCTHGGSSKGVTGVQFSENIYGQYVSENGYIVLAENSTINISNIGSLNYLCTDGATAKNPAGLAAFTYLSPNNQFSTNYLDQIFVGGYDNLGNYYPNSLGNIMYEIYVTNSTEGLAVPNPPNWNGDNFQTYMNVYTFTSPGYYVIYFNKINAQCNSPSSGYPYICPATNSSINFCNIGHLSGNPLYYEGWINIENNLSSGTQYYILVAWPNLSGTYLDNVELYPYYNYSSNEWEVYTNSYSEQNVYASYSISNLYTYQPVDQVEIAYVYNNGYGSDLINLNSEYYNTSLNLSNFVSIPLFINLSGAIQSCYKIDCNINYNITYTDSYGFSGYPTYTFTNDPTITIDWDNLLINYDPQQSVIVYNYPSYIYINVTDLGPVPAENVTYTINSYGECVNVSSGNQITINPQQTGQLIIPVEINNLSCSPSQYYINITISGINTLNYTEYLILPISEILSPSQGSVLNQNTIFNIYDANYGVCYISFNNNTFNRNCNSEFVYLTSYCTGSSICTVSSLNQNQYATFDYITYYLLYPKLVNNILYYSISDPVLSLGVGKYANDTIILDSVDNYTLNCEFNGIPGVTYGNAQVVGWSVNGNKNALSFTISPGGNAIINIQYLGLSNGIDNGIINIYCYDQAGREANLNITIGLVIGQISSSNIIASQKINPYIIYSILLSIFGLGLII